MAGRRKDGGHGMRGEEKEGGGGGVAARAMLASLDMSSVVMVTANL